LFIISGFHFEPTVIVGVVGIGHVQGIVDNWEKDIDIQEIMRYTTTVLLKDNYIKDKPSPEDIRTRCISHLS
jgi:pheromone shutdown protein TraB